MEKQNSVEVGKHRAIKGGYIYLLLLLAAIGGCSWLAFHIIQLPLPENSTQASLLSFKALKWICALVFLCCGVFVFGYVCFFFLPKYWKRNIRGYTLLLWFDYQDGKRPLEVSSDIVTRIKRFDGFHVATLLIPLGGWLNQPITLGAHGHRQYGFGVPLGFRDLYHNWKVRPTKIRDCHPSDMMVQAEDWSGSKLLMTVRSFLVLLELNNNLQVAENMPYQRIKTVNTLAMVMRAHQRETEHLVETIGTLNRTEIEKTQLSDVIIETIKQLIASKRFIQSKQAKQIVEMMLARMESILPPNDQRRALIQATLDAHPGAILQTQAA